MSLRHVFAIILGLLSWLLGAATLIVTASIRGLACDESCGGETWRKRQDAWQWDAVLALGVVTFVAATLFLWMIWKRRRTAATFSFVVGLTAVTAAATAYSPHWVRNLDNPHRLQNLVVGLLAVGAPLAAILLSESSASGQSAAARS